MLQMVERKVRSRAKQLYETRGETEGRELQDWFQAESEVLENSILAPLYRRRQAGSQVESKPEESAEETVQEHSTCETGA